MQKSIHLLHSSATFSDLQVQYINIFCMTARLSAFVSKSLLGIEKQKKFNNLQF